ncbi:MAG: Hpt domain-containing protein, partial [Magnetococcales bacterium]|nr:Hpt domain-containing protein [Magnetococcales bacterium]
SGMTGFIAKPFKAEAAIQQIQALTGKQEKSAPPATPFPIPLADPAAAPFPGLAVENGLAVWKSAPIYRQYLSKFAHTYVDVVRDIREAERAKAASLAHKLKGAAGSLALEEVAALASEVDKRLRGEDDPTDGLVQLQAALDIALESIHRYVQGDATTGTVSSDAKTGL